MEQSGPLSALLLLLVLVRPGEAHFRHPLPVLWMMEQNSSEDRAARLALKDLQEQQAPLGNYEVQMHLVETKCDSVLKSLFDTMWAGPKYLLVLGGTCPVVSRSLSALHLLQVSFTPGAAYRNSFSTAPSPGAINLAAVQLLQHHNWTRVGVVSLGGAGSDQIRRDLIGQFMAVKVEVVAQEIFSDDVCSSLRKMKAADVRIFIGLLDEDSASEVFCCAYKLNLFGSQYQWVVAAPVAGPEAGRPSRSPGSGCRSDDIQTAADGSIILRVQVNKPTTPSESGRTLYNLHTAFSQEGSDVNPVYGYSYDGVWVAAKALIQVREAVKRRERQSMKESEDDVEKLLLEAVRRTQFQGVTGPVMFRQGQRATSVQLVQFQGSREVTVGWFNTDDQLLQFLPHKLRFKGPGPAKDRTVVRLEKRGVSLLLYIIVSSVAAITMSITLTILLFISVKHKLWLSRWSSSCQDWLLLLGLLLSSSSVLVSRLDQVPLPDQFSDILCSVRQWILSVGHTVSFSVLLSRSWRFSSQTSVTQQQQNLLVLFLVLLDVFILATWLTLDPLKKVEMQHDAEVDLVDPGVLVQPVTELCNCNNLPVWTSVVYFSRGPLLGLGCFLALNRRPSSKDQTSLEQTHVHYCVLVMVVFGVIGASTSLFTTHNPSLNFCLSSILVLCCNSIVLAGMFGAKLVALWWSDWEQQKEDKDDNLNIFNWQLKSRVATLDLEIQSIVLQLSEEQWSFSGGVDGGVFCVTHVAQIYDGNTSQRNINSPELVHRRLSVQLPILHHSYLPGGVSASSSISSTADRPSFTTISCTDDKLSVM